jgi:hypothetical protein
MKNKVSIRRTDVVTALHVIGAVAAVIAAFGVLVYTIVTNWH